MPRPDTFLLAVDSNHGVRHGPGINRLVDKNEDGRGNGWRESVPRGATEKMHRKNGRGGSEECGPRECN